ncbi:MULTISPECIES: DeoR/GlpR family DNA-binding transcription regulator [Gemella]|uniref:DeoR/GlpR family DNA-binding transcription regulator n=1 Tax=Gemella TaxID=1378 RepID=UPI0007681C22|nr:MULTISPECIES: DeoR/GlpR family DNA-binding transcription regulator [Gemella]AME09717.1 DeoR family transcriptional regulator [Gemella sp. oral taxon 928]AXI27319.1 DeoR/GlpR transcriptional regulator [Gemella sp. ND 6198]
MYQAQRLEKIMELLSKKGVVSAKEAVEYLGVSRDTIRRDFLILGERDDVQRTHGGLIKQKESAHVSSYNERLKMLTPGKKEIAYKAKKMIKEEGVYFLGASTIIEKLAQLIKEKIIVYSHSLDVAMVLAGNDNINFNLIGGKFFNKNRFYYSPESTEILKNISFDIVFIGAAGVKNGVITLDDYEDVAIKKLVLKNAKIKVLLAEISKFEKSANFILGDITEFDYLITDKEPSAELLKLLGEKVQVIY